MGWQLTRNEHRMTTDEEWTQADQCPGLDTDRLTTDQEWTQAWIGRCPQLSGHRNRIDILQSLGGWTQAALSWCPGPRWTCWPGQGLAESGHTHEPHLQ